MFMPQAVIPWFVAIPNLALGVAILVFRRPIREFIFRLFPRINEGARFWISGVILILGVMQLVLATAVLYIAITGVDLP